MDALIQWLIDNKNWIFSGIGVFVISFFFLKKSGRSQKQKSGSGSINLQSHGDINISSNKNKGEK